MKIDFESRFEKLEKNILNNQKRVKLNSKIGVFYGITDEKYQRLSFLSTILPPQIDSTKMIRVTQGKEGSGEIYWTCFDLLDDNFKKIFFCFCEDMVNSIENINDELIELNTIKDRFYIWRVMFRKNKNQMNPEKEQGLFGELYFLNNYMIKKYGVDEAISSWVGPLGYNKDFSINDMWYEVKTTEVNSIKVKISSLSQLSSKNVGDLVIIRVEKMSENYDDKFSSIIELVNRILKNKMSFASRELLLKKINEYGYDSEIIKSNNKYNVSSMNLYQVKDDFPRLLEEDIKYQEIDDISYNLIIKTLERFKVDE